MQILKHAGQKAMNKQPFVLAFETTLPVLSISLSTGNKEISNFISDGRVSGSNELLSAAESLLQKNDLSLEDINLLAVCAGPGSFTGIRVGLATVKALAYGLGCKALGISILEALALMAFNKQKKSAPNAGASAKINTAVYAGKNQIYTQTFSRKEQGNINYAASAPLLVNTADFIKQYGENISSDNLIITEKKCAAEIKNIQPTTDLIIASDNVSDFIALRALEMVYERSGELEPEEIEDSFNITPLYLRNFRAGQ